jgi:hypothetical protein
VTCDVGAHLVVLHCVGEQWDVRLIRLPRSCHLSGELLRNNLPSANTHNGYLFALSSRRRDPTPPAAARRTQVSGQGEGKHGAWPPMCRSTHVHTNKSFVAMHAYGPQRLAHPRKHTSNASRAFVAASASVVLSKNRTNTLRSFISVITFFRGCEAAQTKMGHDDWGDEQEHQNKKRQCWMCTACSSQRPNGPTTIALTIREYKRPHHNHHSHRNNHTAVSHTHNQQWELSVAQPPTQRALNAAQQPTQQVLGVSPLQPHTA